MTSFSQSPRDRILWILVNDGGKMERSRLRARTGMRCAMLNPILEQLALKPTIIVPPSNSYLCRVLDSGLALIEC
jgi:hypothetical protein